MFNFNSDRSGNGVDYESTPVDAIFVAGTTRATINISLTTDNILEQSETFDLSFIIPPSLHGQVLSGINKAVVNITDDTRKKIFLIYITPCTLLLDIMVNFNESVYHVDENNGPAQLVLLFNNPSSTDITIEVLNTDIKATGVN